MVGENRAQELEAKHARYGSTFRWHFIGHLQSRKAQAVSALCELCHSLYSESAARRLEIPALVQVNLSGEPTKSGVASGELEAFLAECPRRGRVVDHAAARRRPGGVQTVLSPPAGAGGRARPGELSMGTTQDYRVAVDEGATLVRVGAACLFRAKIGP